MEVKVGDVIKLGRYEQSNKWDKDPIEWIVIAVDEGKFLVLSKYLLDVKEYNSEWDDVTWETSDIRKWLNYDFYNSIFTAEEEKKILVTDVTPDKNPSYAANPGNETRDKIFLLSIKEVKKYLKSKTIRKAGETEFVKNNEDAYVDNDNKSSDGMPCGSWWLRSPGCNERSSAEILADGSISEDGEYVTATSVCIRPAMWLKNEP